MDSQNTTPSQRIQIPAEIRNFLDTLLQDAGMLNLDEAMHEEMIKELYARLDSFITATIGENLPPEHLDEFIKMNEENRSQEEIQQFLKEKMPKAEEVFAQAFVEFRDLYLGNTMAAKNAPTGAI